MIKKILIFMSDTGGGHRASAQALQAAFTERYGATFQVDMIDLWMKHAPWPLNELPKSYRFLANDAPWLWELIYRVGETTDAARPIFNAAIYYARRAVSRVVWYYDPDLIISVHPLLTEVPLRILRRSRRQIPFVTVVTDLGSIHPLWFCPAATLCFVPNEEAASMGRAQGMRPEQLRVYGLPIRPVFATEPRPREVLRQELHMHPDLPAALLVGGGEGIGPVVEIAHAVAERLAEDGRHQGRPVGQLVVICGRNQKMQSELLAERWPIPTVINGFVNNMSDWMAASDCIITKAGPGTIAESLVRGLPIILFGFIRGQEEGNVPYVTQHDVGAFSEDPVEIATIVSGWFGPQRALQVEMSQRARQLSNPQATFQIVDDIARLLIGERNLASTPMAALTEEPFAAADQR
jgi:1,2-diacylglycerol 3-beta-galactosyltransferase